MRLIQILGGNGSGKSSALGEIIKHDPIKGKPNWMWTTLESNLRLVGRYMLTKDGRSTGGSENVGTVDQIKEIITHLHNSLSPKATVIMEGMISVSQPIAHWMYDTLPEMDVHVLYLRCDPAEAAERVRLRKEKPVTWDSYMVQQSHRGRNPNCRAVHLLRNPDIDMRELLIDIPTKTGFRTLGIEDVKQWVGTQVYDIAGKKAPSWTTAGCTTG